MKRRRSGLLAVALLFAAVPPAQANQGGSAPGHVTVSSPCIITAADASNPNATAIDYGTLQFSDPALGTAGLRSGSAHPSFTNCSPDLEKVFVRGTDAVSTDSTPTGPAATWLLTQGSVCAASDNYNHGVSDNNSNALKLTTSDQLFYAAAPGGATDTLLSTLYMPCVGSHGAGLTMTLSIVFTASL